MHTLDNIFLVMLIVNLLWTGGKVGFWATGSPNSVSSRCMHPVDKRGESLLR